MFGIIYKLQPKKDIGFDNLKFTSFNGDTLVIGKQVNVIISLAPNVTEIVASIGGFTKLRGITEYCNFPKEVKQISVVGNLQNVDYEKILAIKPDVVFMSLDGNSSQTYKKIKSLGINVYAVCGRTHKDVLKSIMQIGAIIGKEYEAMNLIDKISKNLDSIKSLSINKIPKKVFVIIDKKPIITVAHGFLNESITLAGGVNIAEDKLEDYPKFSREELLSDNPDVIIYPSNLSNSDALKSLVNLYPEFKNLKAIQNKKIFSIDPDIAFRPSPRIVDCCKILFRILK